MNKEKEQSDKDSAYGDMVWEGSPVHPDEAKIEKHSRPEPKPLHTGVAKDKSPGKK